MRLCPPRPLPVELLLRIVELAAEPDLAARATFASPTNPIRDRNSTLCNLCLVSRAFRGVSQTVLVSHVHIFWRAAAAESLVDTLAATPHLAQLVTSATIVYVPLKHWQLEQVDLARRARFWPDSDLDVGSELELDRGVLQAAKCRWDDGPDGVWDAAYTSGRVHGGVEALFRLAAVAPRLAALELNNFTVPYRQTVGPLVCFPHVLDSLRSLTIGTERSDSSDSSLDPVVFVTVLHNTPDLTRLSCPAHAITMQTSTVSSPLPPLLKLSTLHVSDLERNSSDDLGHILHSSPITNLSLTGLVDFTRHKWLQTIGSLPLTSLRLAWWDEEPQPPPSDPTRYTRAIQSYLETCTLKSLRLSLGISAFEDLIPFIPHLPASLELLQLESCESDEPFPWMEQNVLDILSPFLTERSDIVVEVLVNPRMAESQEALELDWDAFEAQGLTLRVGEVETTRPGLPTLEQTW